MNKSSVKRVDVVFSIEMKRSRKYLFRFNRSFKKNLWYCGQRVSHGFFILFKTSLRYVYQTRKWNSHSCWHERIQAESKMKGRQKCPLNYAVWANGYSWFLIPLQLISQKNTITRPLKYYIQQPQKLITKLLIA